MEKHTHLYCKLCDTQTNCGSTTFCRWHLNIYHPEYDTKKYYDEFIKTDNEGVCYCGNITKYKSFNSGYNKFCSKKCQANSIEIKNKIRNTKLCKYDNLNNHNKQKKTLVERYGVENISQIPEVKKKKKLTCIKNYCVENPLQSKLIQLKQKKTLVERYGVENISKHPETEKKRKKTSFGRYGVTHYSKSIEYRIYNEDKGIWIPDEFKTEFELYFRNVWNETKKHKKKLFDSWNGKCYYSDEILNKKINYNEPNYPVIDHKISVYYGFKNNINYKIIGDISNLCICSRKINNKKGVMCENKFINK